MEYSKKIKKFSWNLAGPWWLKVSTCSSPSSLWKKEMVKRYCTWTMGFSPVLAMRSSMAGNMNFGPGKKAEKNILEKKSHSEFLAGPAIAETTSDTLISPKIFRPVKIGRASCRKHL